MKKIERLLKYAEGSKVIKMFNGGPFDSSAYLKWREKNSQLPEGQAQMEFKRIISQPIDDTEEADNAEREQQFGEQNGFNSTEERLDQSLEITEKNPVSEEERAAAELRAEQQEKPSTKKSGFSALGSAALGTGMNAAVQAINAVDGAVMGDKNFSASSQAIDTTVHGVSGALMKSGNPYAMIAGAALEGLNFATKAGGKNVQGYDVGINNSGYGNLGHMESEAGRVWDNWSGATARKLAKRNEQVRMALAAADISQEQQFEQEARLNSVTNVLQQNQIALAGGIDTSLLGS